MQQNLPLSTAAKPSAFNKRVRWIAAASLSVALAALIWFTQGGFAPARFTPAWFTQTWFTEGAAPREAVLYDGALGFERSQARQTIAALGYQELTSLERHDDGSWRARVQKNGAQWQLRISPYGIVSAHLSPQLGIVLE